MSDKSLQGKEQFDRMQDFYKYLEATYKTVFNLFFSDGSIKQVPYKHRWSEVYRKSVMCKLYQLEAWAKRHGLKFGMISLTTSQAGLTDKQILENLKEGWDLLRQSISKMEFQYLCLYEPHESGIAHIHVLLIGDITDEGIERLRKLWVEKYKMGNEHAYEFTAGRKALDSLRNYLMKYMAKTVCIDVHKDDALMRFHSLFWEMGYRLWSSRRYLTFVMGMIKKRDNPNAVFLCAIEMDGAIEGNIYERNERDLQVFDVLKRCFKKDTFFHKPDGIVYGIASLLSVKFTEGYPFGMKILAVNSRGIHE